MVCRRAQLNWDCPGNASDKITWTPDVTRNTDSRAAVTYLRYKRNITVVTVYNFAPLQHTSCEANLRAFMRRMRFDAAFYMYPHDDCFFRYQQFHKKACAAEPTPPHTPTLHPPTHPQQPKHTLLTLLTQDSHSPTLIHTGN